MNLGKKIISKRKRHSKIKIPMKRQAVTTVETQSKSIREPIKLVMVEQLLEIPKDKMAMLLSIP